MSLSSRLAALLRRSSLVAPALAAIILGVLAIGAPAPALDRVRDLLFDQFQVWSPRPWSPDLPVRIIAIDDEAIARFGQWPWPRDRMAELTGKLAALGPAAIGFDIVFSEPDRLSTSAPSARRWRARWRRGSTGMRAPSPMPSQPPPRLFRKPSSTKAGRQLRPRSRRPS